MNAKSTQNLVLFLAVALCGAAVCFCSGCSGVKRIDLPQAMQAKQKPQPPSPSSTVDSDLPNDSGLTAAVGKALQGNRDIARKYYALYRAYAEACDGNSLGWKERSDLDTDFKKAQKLARLTPGEIPEFLSVVSTHLAPLTGIGDVTPDWLADCETRFGQLAFACREAAK